MNILGLSEGTHSGAALVVDGRVVAAEAQERFDRQPRSAAFPWAAMEHVLLARGLRPAEIDVVAVVGPSSSKRLLRRLPSVRRARLDRRFQERGFARGIVRTLHMGDCLASAAYRSQALGEVLVFTAHPEGQGGSVAVHVGSGGELRPQRAPRGVDLGEVIERQLREAGGAHVVLAGELANHPRLLGDIVELEGLRSLHVLPSPGFGSLALGAALHAAELSPRAMSPTLGTSIDPAAARRALGLAKIKRASGSAAAHVGAVLAAGASVGRFVGPSSAAAHGAAARSVLVRADDAGAIERARASLLLDGDGPVCVLAPRAAFEHIDRIGQAASVGVVALRTTLELAPSLLNGGRVVARALRPDEVELSEALERSGAPALAVFALGEGGEPPAGLPEHATRVHRRAKLGALWMDGVVGEECT